MAQNGNQIGALWKKKSKKNGVNYLSGTINGVKVVVFANKNKNSDTHPDYYVLESQPLNGQSQQAPQQQRQQPQQQRPPQQSRQQQPPQQQRQQQRPYQQPPPAEIPYDDSFDADPNQDPFLS